MPFYQSSFQRPMFLKSPTYSLYPAYSRFAVAVASHSKERSGVNHPKRYWRHQCEKRTNETNERRTKNVWLRGNCHIFHPSSYRPRPSARDSKDFHNSGCGISSHNPLLKVRTNSFQIIREIFNFCSKHVSIRPTPIVQTANLGGFLAARVLRKHRINFPFKTPDARLSASVCVAPAQSQGVTLLFILSL